MKHLLLTIALTAAVTATTFGQEGLDFFSFDDTTGLNRLDIDTINYSNNIWQIGSPQKTTFTNAYSVPNAIVTDTLNSYPINDTSSFIITHIVHFPGAPNSANEISGSYYVNSDTINDYGSIEYSLNSGPWVNIDTAIFNWGTPNLPILSGNSNGWKYFVVTFFTNSLTGDTLRFRFMFISDGIQTNKDGLMFDNLFFDDMSEGIEEPGSFLIFSKAFPNPTIDNLRVEFENNTNSTYKFTILDNTGKIVKTYPDIKNSYANIDIQELSSGIYYYKLINTIDKKYAAGRFIKQ